MEEAVAIRRDKLILNGYEVSVFLYEVEDKVHMYFNVDDTFPKRRILPAETRITERKLYANNDTK